MARQEQVTGHVRDRRTEANRSGCHRHRRQSNSHAPNYRSPTVPWARRGNAVGLGVRGCRLWWKGQDKWVMKWCSLVPSTSTRRRVSRVHVV